MVRQALAAVQLHALDLAEAVDQSLRELHLTFVDLLYTIFISQSPAHSEAMPTRLGVPYSSRQGYSSR